MRTPARTYRDRAAGGTRRGIRRTLAALGTLALALGAVALPTAATAATGYVGQTASTWAFENYPSNRTLPLMTAGEAYSGSLQGPQYGGTSKYFWWIDAGDLPTGISLSATDSCGGEPCGTHAYFTGTPEAGEYEFTVALQDEARESTIYLDFEITLEDPKSPTVTTITLPEYVSTAAGLVLQAEVEGAPQTHGTPTGTVVFAMSGAGDIGTASLAVDGTATTTVNLDAGAAGVREFTARYLGNDDYSPSSSGPLTVAIYIPTAEGTVVWNGLPVGNATVALVHADAPTTMAASGTTDVTGAFTLTPAVYSRADAERAYLVVAEFPDGTVLHYKSGTANVTDVADAGTTSPTTWTASLTIARTTPPTWDDDVLATPRIGSAYSDSVTATSRNDVSYSVTAGTLPSGLTLTGSTGAVTGTPTCAAEPCTYDFTITADNGYGTVSRQFTGTLLPAGVPPTWVDDELPELRVDVAVADGVEAEGDADITYAVTAGALPAGLTLDPATGAITGTPTTEGAYAFTITASNDYGSITADFTGDVEAKPALGLKLDFAVGTLISDARTTISSEGLQVGSTYTLTMFSKPRLLHTGIVDATGGFSLPVKLPADTPAGAHRLLLEGIAADGTPMSDEAWFALGADGRIVALSYSGPVSAGLAGTGADAATGALAAGLLLALGLGIVAIDRRRARRA